MIIAIYHGGDLQAGNSFVQDLNVFVMNCSSDDPLEVIFYACRNVPT